MNPSLRQTNENPGTSPNPTSNFRNLLICRHWTIKCSNALNFPADIASASDEKEQNSNWSAANFRIAIRIGSARDALGLPGNATFGYSSLGVLSDSLLSCEPKQVS